MGLRISRAAVAGLLTVPFAAIATTTTASARSAVPDVAELAGELADQTLTWQTCDFGDPDLNDTFNQPNVQCATVTVPRDWHHPDNGKTWKIRISQAKNRDVTDGRYQGTIFVNPGGPGGSGLVWGPAMDQLAPDLKPYYNFVGFDPRGVGLSSHATCDYTFDPDSSDPNAEVKAMAASCSTNADVQTINTEQTAYDMDFIRYLLQAPKLSYIGYSYGTWLGTWYENVFGATYGDKFLLDSSIDGTEATLESTWDLQPIARDRQFSKRIMYWIARHDDDYHLGQDPYLINKRYFEATAKLDPLLVLLVWVLGGGYNAFTANSEYPLAGETVAELIAEAETPQTAPAVNPAAAAKPVITKINSKVGKIKSFSGSDSTVLDQLAQLPTADQAAKQRTAAEETETADDVFTYVLCNDGQWTQGEAYWTEHNAALAKKAPLSNQLGTITMSPCAFWRTDNLMPVADQSFPDTVVVQDEMDSQTGWEGGSHAGRSLPNTSLIAVDNEGSHGLFPYGTEAVDRPIYNFFLDRNQPKNITVAQGRTLPGDTTTYESWRRLNKRAKHVGAPVTSPWQEAGEPGDLTSASDVGRALLANSARDQLLRQQVQRIYGKDGVAVLDAAGVQ